MIRKAFTLVELLVVIAIIGILVACACLGYQGDCADSPALSGGRSFIATGSASERLVAAGRRNRGFLKRR